MLAGLYLTYAAVMVALHPQFIYPFGPHPLDRPDFRQEVVTDRDVAMAISTQQGETAVLFFMGNGGALAYFAPLLDAHLSAGRSVAAMEYPGGGGIPGKPSELRMKADALAAYDWLTDRHDGPIVVHGYSLGTGLALHVAAHRPVSAVVLDAPYMRMCELMTRASYLPACMLPGVQRWDSTVDVPDVTVPVLIQHGSSDQLIPIRHGERLAHLMRDSAVPVTFAPISGATHDNLPVQPGYAGRIDTFLNGLTDQP